MGAPAAIESRYAWASAAREMNTWNLRIKGTSKMIIRKSPLLSHGIIFSMFSNSRIIKHKKVRPMILN
jgi:hypothetical protein